MKPSYHCYAATWPLHVSLGLNYVGSQGDGAGAARFEIGERVEFG